MSLEIGAVIYESDVKSKGSVNKQRHMILTEDRIIIACIQATNHSMEDLPKSEKLGSQGKSLTRSFTKSLKRLNSRVNSNQSLGKSEDSMGSQIHKRSQIEILLKSIILVKIDVEKSMLTLKFKENDDEVSELSFITVLCQEWERRIRMLLILENPFLYDRDFPL